MAVTPEHAGLPGPACGARGKNYLLFLGKATSPPKGKAARSLHCLAWRAAAWSCPLYREQEPFVWLPKHCGSAEPSLLNHWSRARAACGDQRPRHRSNACVGPAAAPAPTAACPHATVTGPSSPSCGAYVGHVCHRCQPSAWSLPGTELLVFPHDFSSIFPHLQIRASLQLCRVKDKCRIPCARIPPTSHKHPHWPHHHQHKTLSHPLRFSQSHIPALSGPVTPVWSPGHGWDCARFR